MTRIAFLSLLLAGMTAWAGQVYKWTDDKGKVHYGDKPVAAGAAKVEQKIGTVPPGQTEAELAQAKQAQECAAETDKLAAYKSAVKVVEHDMLGHERIFTGAEKQKLVDMQKKKMSDTCSGVPPAAAEAAK